MIIEERNISLYESVMKSINLKLILGSEYSTEIVELYYFLDSILKYKIKQYLGGQLNIGAEILYVENLLSEIEINCEKICKVNETLVEYKQNLPPTIEDNQIIKLINTKSSVTFSLPDNEIIKNFFDINGDNLKDFQFTGVGSNIELRTDYYTPGSLILVELYKKYILEQQNFTSIYRGGDNQYSSFYVKNYSNVSPCYAELIALDKTKEQLLSSYLADDYNIVNIEASGNIILQKFSPEGSFIIVTITGDNLGNEVTECVQVQAFDDHEYNSLPSNIAKLDIIYRAECETIPEIPVNQTITVVTGVSYSFTTSNFYGLLDGTINKIKIISLNISEGDLYYKGININNISIPFIITKTDLQSGDLTYISYNDISPNICIEFQYYLAYEGKENYSNQISSLLVYNEDTVLNQPPVAVISNTPEGVYPTIDYVLLDGTSSSDPEGDVLIYQWGIVSQPGNGYYEDASIAIAKFFLTTAGTYTLSLTVTDTKGNQNTTTVTFTILPKQ